jgi:hypothetical protein
MPYEDISSEPIVLKAILDGHIPPRPADTSVITDDLWEICLQCWRLDPMDRLDVQEILVKLTELGSSRDLNVTN